MLFALAAVSFVSSLFLFNSNKQSKLAIGLLLASIVLLYISWQSDRKELEDRCFRGDAVACADIDLNEAYDAVPDQN